MNPDALSPQFRSLLEDDDLVDEIQELAARGNLPLLHDLGVPPAAVSSALEATRRASRGLESLTSAAPRPGMIDFSKEAIILQHGRPSLIVQNGTFALPDSPIWRDNLLLHKSNIEDAIARVGRVELLHHLTYDWVGTAWIIAPDIVVTNRHVADEFVTRADSGELGFSTNVLGRIVEAKIDFREEYEIDVVIEVRVTKVLYVAARGEPDIALLQIEADLPLPEPIPLSRRDVESRQIIGVVGYPAFDSRNGVDAMRHYFGEIYDVKRFAPGKVSFPTPDEHYFVHDCTTLGGNSGSKILDLETGEVVGLHFAGEFLSGNFAVKTQFLEDALASIRVSVPGSEIRPQVLADGRNDPASFEDRDGYRSDFLGANAHVTLPALGPWSSDAAPVAGALDATPHVARYRHFSVIVSKRRKLPIVTAVNINGAEARRAFRRDDRWFIDGRIDNVFQVGNEVYKHNDLDRGHMVRRLDPVWGGKEEAQQANDDTFHYVNAVPQHKDLNQREWNDLEQHILDRSRALDLKVSVFTGPVLRDDDRIYRQSVRLPREFWKIAVLVNTDTGRLSATGYILSQGDMIQDVTEAAFVFGEFRTYQVSIARIEEHTGLDFGPLREFDPLNAPAEEGAVSVPRVVPIRSGREIVFS